MKRLSYKVFPERKNLRQILVLAIRRMGRIIDISQFDKKFRENHRRFFSEHEALLFVKELFKAKEITRILTRFTRDKRAKRLTPQEQLAKDIDETLR